MADRFGSARDADVEGQLATAPALAQLVDQVRIGLLEALLEGDRSGVFHVISVTAPANGE